MLLLGAGHSGSGSSCHPWLVSKARSAVGWSGSCLDQQRVRVLPQMQVGQRRPLLALPRLARQQLRARVAPAGGGLGVGLAAPEVPDAS
jgi:hypothetical protein